MLAFLNNLGKRNRRILAGLGLLLFTQGVVANFSIDYATTRLEKGVYLLNAKLSYALSETAMEALHNGVALTLVLTITIERERWYLWDETVTTLKQGYQLKYYALNGQYVVKSLNTNIQETFPSLPVALATLGNLEGLPLLDKHLLKAKGNYWIHLQAYLDIESLPLPLRPLAYLSSQWRLSSDWYLCPLQPPPN